MAANLLRASEHPAPSNATTCAHSSRHTIFKWMLTGVGLTMLLAGCQTGPTALPLAGNPFAPVEPTRLSVGDTYVYRYSDGYGNLPNGQVSYRVEQLDGDRIVMAVTPDIAREGDARTEVYSREGNWLRHMLLSHNQPLDREFTPGYPRYVFPLLPGKKWSMRVVATNPADQSDSQQVHVNGKVIGAERIRVAAGEFDTIKIRRDIFIDDFGSAQGGFLNMASPTHFWEFEWYSPELGRAVRSENYSEWRVSGKKDPWVLGDWNVYELASLPVSTR